MPTCDTDNLSEHLAADLLFSAEQEFLYPDLTTVAAAMERGEILEQPRTEDYGDGRDL